MIISDASEIIPETKMVTIKIVTTQRIVFLRSFLDSDGSDLDKGISPLYFMCDGSRQDKSYGLGRVGFPHPEPAVAAQAVSV